MFKCFLQPVNLNEDKENEDQHNLASVNRVGSVFAYLLHQANLNELSKYVQTAAGARQRNVCQQQR